MKCQILSDLHIEFSGNKFEIPTTNSDIMIFSGDIGVGFENELNFLKYTLDKHQKPIIFILGNHSFYGGDYDRIKEKWYNLSHEGIYFLDEGLKVNIDNINFIGGTLWGDMGNYDFLSCELARSMINDYRRIKMLDENNNRVIFSPYRSIDEHYKLKKWIENNLEENKKNVLVIHHLPSYKSINEKYLESNINHTFASHLDNWLDNLNITHIFHGHTHSSCDYILNGKTRIICNPRGYYGSYDLNPEFNSSLIIEI